MQVEYTRLADTLHTPVLAVRAAAVCAFVRCAGCGAKRCNRDILRCNRDTRCGAWEDILKSQLPVPGVACCAATGTHCAAAETHRAAAETHCAATGTHCAATGTHCAATETHRAAAETHVAEPRTTFSQVSSLLGSLSGVEQICICMSRIIFATFS